MNEINSPEFILPEMTMFGPEHLILEEIGRGGMGVVYKAKHLGLERSVALKTLRKQQPTVEEVERFSREIAIASRFDHPNIVPIYDVGAVDGRPFFTMPLVQEMTLQDYCSAEGMNSFDATRIMISLCRAVQHIHDHEVVHRDLKPENIFVSDGDECRITDFGLAKDRIAGQPPLTKEAQGLGTLGFVSPEQRAGQPNEVDHRSDVYSLGAILCNLLLGNDRFYRLTAEMPLDVAFSRSPNPIRSTNPTVAEDIELICRNCLKDRKEQRYSSVRDLETDLANLLAAKPIKAKDDGADQQLLEEPERVCPKNARRAAELWMIYAILCSFLALLATAFGVVRLVQFPTAALSMLLITAIPVLVRAWIARLFYRLAVRVVRGKELALGKNALTTFLFASFFVGLGAYWALSPDRFPIETGNRTLVVGATTMMIVEGAVLFLAGIHAAAGARQYACWQGAIKEFEDSRHQRMSRRRINELVGQLRSHRAFKFLEDHPPNPWHVRINGNCEVIFLVGRYTEKDAARFDVETEKLDAISQSLAESHYVAVCFVLEGDAPAVLMPAELDAVIDAHAVNPQTCFLEKNRLTGPRGTLVLNTSHNKFPYRLYDSLTPGSAPVATG